MRKDLLQINTSKAIHFFDVNKIFFCKSRGKVTEFHLNESIYLSNKNLGEHEKDLEIFNTFVRIHHSYIININYLLTVDKSKFNCTLINNANIPISRRKLKKLIHFLSNNK
ncbi:LytR/AlgR family response regulator transcription factor [Flavobacterium proteolyticum]|uniref:LytTR family transcriptional regulator DNA-binding domain-containing protein n=1 Tax=Flavobacterium proteolyticum TaxID=2911683 RepID=A0ABR9WPC3_9FLAO|nr:LytTR family DNA-binding domain-containing protein [Flavobacterium proteolyticum]MBE9575091.1 LytTR family transcriptional regulator DNA-binding domain-containing protein [Flavobacterium proteolyticum]